MTRPRAGKREAATAKATGTAAEAGVATVAAAPSARVAGRWWVEWWRREAMLVRSRLAGPVRAALEGVAGLLAFVEPGVARRASSIEAAESAEAA